MSRRLDYFGVNVGHDPVFRAWLIAEAGFNAVRIVLQRAVDLCAYIEECHASGVRVAGVIASESFNDWSGEHEPGAPRKMGWDEAAQFYAQAYPNLDALCIGNETDGQEGVNTDGSWIIDTNAFNLMKTAFVREFRARAPATRLWGVGTVTGQPERIAGYDLSGLDGLDNHAYAQWPDSVGGMLGNYNDIAARFGLAERVVTEFGWPDPDPAERGQYIANMVRAFEELDVSAAFVYCWDLRQHTQPFGLVDGDRFTAAIPYIQALGYRPGAATPRTGPYWFALGFGEWATAQPELIGEPLENEWGAAPGISQQRTTRGLLTWADLVGGPVMTFLSNDGRRYVRTVGGSREIARS